MDAVLWTQWLHNIEFASVISRTVAVINWMTLVVQCPHLYLVTLWDWLTTVMASHCNACRNYVCYCLCVFRSQHWNHPYLFRLLNCDQWQWYNKRYNRIRIFCTPHSLNELVKLFKRGTNERFQKIPCLLSAKTIR